MRHKSGRHIMGPTNINKQKYQSSCYPIKTYKSVSVVERDFQRKQEIEAQVKQHKKFLIQYVSPSNRIMFGLMFENWIKVPPWVGPTVQEADREKERSKKAFYKLRQQKRKVSQSSVSAAKNGEITLKRSSKENGDGAAESKSSPASNGNRENTSGSQPNKHKPKKSKKKKRNSRDLEPFLFQSKGPYDMKSCSVCPGPMCPHDCGEN